jgi:hypothetical protein
VRILRNRREIQYVVLSCIRTMAQEHPAIFRPFLSELFVKESDPVFNRIQKLEVLTSICTKENIQSILSEFQVYIKHANIDYVCAVIRALGRAADVDNEVAGKCTDGLLQLISFNKNPAVVQQCVIVIRQLIQQNSGTAASHKALNVLAKLMIAEVAGTDWMLALPDTMSLVPNSVAIVDMGDTIIVRRGQMLVDTEAGDSLLSEAVNLATALSTQRFPAAKLIVLKQPGLSAERLLMSRLSPSHTDSLDTFAVFNKALSAARLSREQVTEMAENCMPTDQPSFSKFLSDLVPDLAQYRNQLVSQGHQTQF